MNTRVHPEAIRRALGVLRATTGRGRRPSRDGSDRARRVAPWRPDTIRGRATSLDVVLGGARAGSAGPQGSAPDGTGPTEPTREVGDGGVELRMRARALRERTEALLRNAERDFERSIARAERRAGRAS